MAGLFVVSVVLRGPQFGTYAPEEVGWLLKDLSDYELERPLQERERQVQLEGAHYSESLPIEFEPSDVYLGLYQDLLRRWAGPVAGGIAELGDLLLADRGPEIVLVSLARAGTPVGILLRRWLKEARGLTADHYAISIIRGKGLDEEAVIWLRDNVGLDRVVFVDGWTGKGAIADCLEQSVHEMAGRGLAGLDSRLAVVADPAGVTTLCATRSDILIPSSCLNSTVSGLVSRTVHSRSLIGAGEFHGAKFYRHLVDADLSGEFLDTIAGRFPHVSPRARHVEPPRRIGAEACRDLADRFGVTDLNLVKPGLGEATRVLLRRRPARLLVRDLSNDCVQHLLLLASDRHVPVEVVPTLPFEAVGLIARVLP